MSLLSWAQNLLGVAAKVAPNAGVTTSIGGLPATIDVATAQAGLAALGKIPWDQIVTEFNNGQIVTAGVMLTDDAASVIDKFMPALIPAEKVLDFAVQLGLHSTAHNSGEGGIGALPEGNSNVGA